jgi:dihydropyrimidine dehydrogenase (NAD+) subunit PreA
MARGAEFILLGCGTVQVCTAVMHYGYRIVEDMIDGLTNWMDEKNLQPSRISAALVVPKVTEWKHLDLNYKIVARIIDEAKCIGCELCYIACWDGAHQCIHLDRVSGPVDGRVELHAKPAAIEAATREHHSHADSEAGRACRCVKRPERTPLARIPRIDETECVGCNLCSLVCPVENCITMVEVATGAKPETWAERTEPTEVETASLRLPTQH